MNLIYYRIENGVYTVLCPFGEPYHGFDGFMLVDTTTWVGWLECRNCPHYIASMMENLDRGQLICNRERK